MPRHRHRTNSQYLRHDRSSRSQRRPVGRRHAALLNASRSNCNRLRNKIGECTRVCTTTVCHAFLRTHQQLQRDPAITTQLCTPISRPAVVVFFRCSVVCVRVFADIGDANCSLLLSLSLPLSLYLSLTLYLSLSLHHSLSLSLSLSDSLSRSLSLFLSFSLCTVTVPTFLPTYLPTYRSFSPSLSISRSLSLLLSLSLALSLSLSLSLSPSLSRSLAPCLSPSTWVYILHPVCVCKLLVCFQQEVIQAV